jgi:hypothetical protein
MAASSSRFRLRSASAQTDEAVVPPVTGFRNG